MKRIFIITSFTLSLLQSFAQISISGVITDKDDHKIIRGAHIIIEGENKGAISDESGKYTILCSSLPCKLKITHIQYQPITLTIQSESQTEYNFQMIRDIKEIQTFTLTDQKIFCLHPGDRYFISDFSILDDKLLAVAYKNRMKGNQFLIMFDTDGSKIHEVQISAFKGLFQDPEKNSFIKMYNKGWQIFHDSTGIYFSEPFEDRHIDSAEKRLAAIKNDTIFLRDHFSGNQGLAYYFWASDFEHPKEFRAYINEEGLNMLYWGPFFDGNEFDQRFAEQIFFKPVKIPIFVEPDHDIIIFNFIDNKIEKYHCIQCEIYETTDIIFNEDKSWTGEIIYDKAKNKFYTLFKRQGISRVSEINIMTGELMNETILGGYAHIEKVTVWNGKLYFLYKNFHGDEYKRLYMCYLY